MSAAVTVLLLSFALPACLVPQSVDPADTRQHTVPIIDLNALFNYFLAPEVQLYLAGTDDVAQQCHCRLQLEIPVVKNDDPTIDLQARWFIDYDVGTPPSQFPIFTQDLPGSFNPVGTIRDPVKFELDADNLGLQPGRHAIEVVIAERQGFTADNDTTAVYPHRSTRPGWDATTYKVVMNLQASKVTQCDRNTPLRSPPLIRVCTQ